jgi:predicted nucleic acid-binding protein
MNAVDTNILVYAHDPRDPVKQAKALSLIEAEGSGVLLWQVACEYLSASRKLARFDYDLTEAKRDLDDMRDAWTFVLPKWEILDRASGLLDRYSLSFWDALLLAACLQAGVERLYSEDFDAYNKIDTLEVVNPFRG